MDHKEERNGDAEHVRIDPGSESAVESIVKTVARVRGVPPSHLPPLYSVLDPETIDSLFALTESPHVEADWSLRFEYVGVRVRAFSNGDVWVENT
ncbi:MAG: HalOD1 output domain-containing protein [Salinigranum sp.]